MKTVIFALLFGCLPAQAEEPNARIAACYDALTALFEEAGPTGSADPDLANRIMQKRAQCERLKKTAKHKKEGGK